MMVLASMISLKAFFNDKDSIALAFLIVYLNSTYWELSLHSVALIHGEIINTIRQVFTHFYFIPLLIRLVLIVDKRRIKKTLLHGLIFSTVIMISFGLFRLIGKEVLHISGLWVYTPYIWAVNRIGCLVFLLKAFTQDIIIRDD
jgi:hypothetical protein